MIHQNDAHLGLPYQEVTEAGYTEHVAQSFKIGQRGADFLMLHGSCPRCNGPMQVPLVTVALKAMLPRLTSRRTTASSGFDIHPMICACRSTNDHHPGRPDGHTGCGAYWTIGVTKEPT